MSELHTLGVAGLSRKFAAKEVSPSEAVDHLLKRIDRLDPKINAFVRVTGDAARAAAKAATEAIAAGRGLGRLHGIPFAIKDIYDTAGVATTGHSKLYIDRVPKQDATTVAKLTAAGAISLGKLATHEFATGGPAFDLPFPPARNPWNPDHFTGGSSSGSGAALAARLVPAALGSDTSGSIRNPAAYCGISGHKPTYGLCSRGGVMPLSQSLDHTGPMARSAEDCAYLLTAMQGHDARDPASADRHPENFAANLDKPIRGVRVGVVRRWYEQDMTADPEQVSAFEAAVKEFEALGVEIVPVDVPPLGQFDAACRVILHAEAFAIHHADLKRRPMDYAKITRMRVLSGAAVTAEEYMRAQRFRRTLCLRMAEVFKSVDLLLTPVYPGPAPSIDVMAKFLEATVPPRGIAAPFNITGGPALAVPCGFSKAGLPLNIQVAGRAFEDGLVLRAAHAFQKATDWHTRQPALA